MGRLSNDPQANEAYHRLRSCERKTRYATHEEAEQNKWGQKVYQCKFCQGFHRTGIADRLARRREKEMRPAKAIIEAIESTPTEPKAIAEHLAETLGPPAEPKAERTFEHTLEVIIEGYQKRFLWNGDPSATNDIFIQWKGQWRLAKTAERRFLRKAIEKETQNQGENMNEMIIEEQSLRISGLEFDLDIYKRELDLYKRQLACLRSRLDALENPLLPAKEFISGLVPKADE